MTADGDVLSISIPKSAATLAQTRSIDPLQRARYH
jgi:hypothetical protein